ncbi:MAG: TonB-dependent receptor, partial [Bacteroidetes bacterium]|nr:TonB-dependent receptor [Bacteroidota bacterium]
LSLVIANGSQLQSNDNYSKRKLIPDARLAESNASAYLNFKPGKWSFELSSGAGFKWIETLLTPTVNSEEKEIDPFSSTRSFVNGMAGISRQFGSRLVIKTNVATGVRVPNLAELSSNGLHEGFYTYELGNPELKNERNLNTSLELIWQSRYFGFAGSAYSNRFENFVFLEPGYGEWFGFPVYRYVQRNALIYGAEMKLDFFPLGKRSLSVSCTASGLEARLDGGNYLPWMPARKLKPEIKLSPQKEKWKNSFIYLNSDYVFAQNLVFPGETVSPSYFLLNAGCGNDFQTGNLTIQINLIATNLLNQGYADHLSRIRNFGQLNMGRNIILQIKINHNSKNNKNEK